MSFQLTVGRLPHLTERATEACHPCRRLKRRCSKELPSCALCTRLGKACDYSSRSTQSPADVQLLLAKIQDLEQRLEQAGAIKEAAITTPDSKLPWSRPPQSGDRSAQPSLYFIDSEIFEKQPAILLDPGMQVPDDVLKVLGSRDDIHKTCTEYFATIDTSLPMISRKRLSGRLEAFAGDSDASLALLLLTMKLTTQSLDRDEDPRNASYWSCRQYYTQVEETPLLSLGLLQAKILIALYEIGHGIYPAGFLSVAHAARLGQLIGLHDRKRASQLFRPTATWSGREEERRVCTAILGMKGCPLTTSELASDELLPCGDAEWLSGAIGCNSHVLSPYDEGVTLGRYAQVCQAVHMLGRVQQHRKDSTLERKYKLEEALLLNNTLVTLHAAIQQSAITVGADHPDSAIAICCSARFMLYELYACNEHYEGSPMGEEGHMQVLALQGIEQCVAGMYELALRIQQDTTAEHHSSAIHVTHALYWAASECRWYIKEGKQDAVKVLDSLTTALEVLNRRWRRAGDYLKLLEREELESD